MLLMSHDRLHAAHAARSAAELNSSDHFVLPSIVSPSRSMPAHRRASSLTSPAQSYTRSGSISPTRGVRGTIGGSPSRAPAVSQAGAMSLAEIAKVGPSTLEVLKFAEASGPRKSVSLGQPQGDDVEAALEKELQQCSAPGPQEKHMSEAQQLLVSNVRTEVLMFKPNKVLLVNQLHDLVESLILDVRARESTIDIANAKIRDTEERAAAEKQHAEQEILKKEALIAAKDKELMQGQLKRSELEETIKGLEERLTTAAGIGMTAEDAARTMMQLTKAKASIEAMKKQIAELEDKVVTMERQKRQEEMALKEKKAAIERQLKETLQEYGPEKFRELTERLQEATHELDVTSQNLSKSKVAQKQQHKLVVSWRISVDDMTAKMEQQSKEMEDLRLDIEKKGITISDLEAQLWQSEQDLKKQSLQLTQLNEKMNEYIEKYTRQAAYISEMEAKWKAAEAERLLAEGGDDSD